MELAALTWWNADPVTLALLVVLLGGYALTLGPLRDRLLPGVVVPRGRIAAYLGGVALLGLTLLSPLDTLGREYLLTARIAQVLILVTFVAPLLMIGLPDELAARLLPVKKWREVAGTPLFVVFAVVAFNAIILFWQIPRFYDLSAQVTLWHDVANLCYLFAGVLTWWPLLTPANRRARMASPLQMVYLALESLPIDIFGITIIFASGPLYATYIHAPRITGLTAMVDQQIAGALLALPGNLLDILFMSIIFFVWIERIEQAQREREMAEIERETAADATSAVSGERPDNGATTEAIGAEDERAAQGRTGGIGGSMPPAVG
ncbi:MAG TPA: cytochrome c oxidase assembly protein [Ktedonobacterales bacterium]|nr:cytochrome c oxidase assembly protein [Ktedonobacterales bacterium]